MKKKEEKTKITSFVNNCIYISVATVKESRQKSVSLRMELLF